MISRTMRVLGALTLLAVGAVHLQEYLGDGYQTIPTIGPLFVLNAVAAAVVAAGLLLPVERMLSERQGEFAVGALAIAGVAIAAGSLIALFVAENAGLFGFKEAGGDSAVTIAIVTEAATVTLLAPLAGRHLARGFSSPARA